MRIYRSNRLEVLAQRLAEVVAVPCGGAEGKVDPLAALQPETIVVQSRGMERWLSQDLAQRLGVWARPSFPFPRAFLEGAFNAVLGEPPSDPGAFARGPMTFAVARELSSPEERGQGELGEARGYVGPVDRDEGAVRRMELAGRVAEVFDRYPIYRPDVVLGWERSRGGGWQGALFRRLVARSGSVHTAARAHAFLEAVKGGSPLPLGAPGLPMRLSVFGVSSLPPLYVDIFAALARHAEVHLFLLSPSRGYWGEVRPRRDALREAARGHGTLPAEEVLVGDEGHPLLASLGRLGRDFQAILEERLTYDEVDAHVDPAQVASPTTLARLQQDLLDLRPTMPLPADGAITVHSCASPFREVEVLKDQVLALLDADSTLAPRDIVVMAPDIEAYAPFVEAVFGGGAAPLPYRIADRGARARSAAASAMGTLLEVAAGRLRASDVMDLLALEPVRRCFALDAEELDVLRGWVRDANARWGRDGAHRAEVGLPPLEDATWRFAMDRLFLGYGMPGAGRDVFEGVLPCDDVEGEQGLLLGKLGRFCDELFALGDALRTPRPVADLVALLRGALETFLLVPPDRAAEILALRGALASLEADAMAAGFDSPVTLAALQGELGRRLDEGGDDHGFLSGGVTFCRLMPMRAIPFRVVALLGMAHDAFPRATSPVSFDLLAREPRPGDPSPRDQDRYLFLEALLAARERILITYVGQGVRDHATAPPSVVVSELLDATGAEAATVVHPLQPFSARYFAGDPSPGLLQYGTTFLDGARALANARAPEGGPRVNPPFVGRPRPLAEARERVLDIGELARFLGSPAKSFLRSVLGVRLADTGDELRGLEAFQVGPLEGFLAGGDLVGALLAGDTPDEALQRLRLRGDLPLGAWGDLECAIFAEKGRALASEVRRLGGGTERRVIPMDLTVGTTRLVGGLTDVYPAARVEVRFAKMKARPKVGLWVRHLALLAAGAGTRSYLVGHDPKEGAAVASFGPVDDARRTLASLVDLYWLGQTTPLLFFPEAAAAFVAAEAKGLPVPAALERARKAFEPDDHIHTEGNDDHLQLLLRGVDPFVESPTGVDPRASFVATARTILEPLLECEEGA